MTQDPTIGMTPKEVRAFHDLEAGDMTDIQVQQKVFEYMLARLEDAGKCRFIFHELARVLFGDHLT